MTLPRLPACLLAAVLTALVLLPAPAHATLLPTVDLTSDPWFVGWSELLPPGYLGVDTDSSDVCVAGQLACVAKVARILARQVGDLGCDHNAVFSLAYLRMTEKVRDTVVDDPGFFGDTPWLNHYDATFADFYLAAWNAERTGAAPPPAWRIAFDAADDQRVSGSGNLLLGVSAHVNRDLAFTLYSIGLVAPDGTSRKADHDKVNILLNQLYRPLVDEIATRYDPSAASLPGIGSVADLLEFQLLPAWREQAWRNATLLATAHDAAARRLIAADIEDSARLEAQSLLALTRYLPPLSGPQARNRFCATVNA